MQGFRAGSRYAKALVQLAEDKKVLESVYQDINVLRNALDNSNDLLNLLQSPVVKTEKKKVILKEIFQGKINDITLDFILMVTSQKREAVLPIIADSFIEIYNKKNNIAKVHVTTATKISDDLRNQLLNKIKESYNFSSIDLQETVDEYLIGGIVIRIGDKQLDESIRRKIIDVEQELINA